VWNYVQEEKITDTDAILVWERNAYIEETGLNGYTEVGLVIYDENGNIAAQDLKRLRRTMIGTTVRSPVLSNAMSTGTSA